MAPNQLIVNHCRGCGAENELPYLFCQACARPRIGMGHWRVAINLSLAFTAFTSIFLFARYLAWSWPLYLAFWLFLIQFALLLMGGRRTLALRAAGWLSTAAAGFFILFHFMHPEGRGDFIFFFLHTREPLRPDFLLTLLGGLPDLAREETLHFFSALGALLVVVFGFGYLRWVRRYGWANAYRIVLLSLLTLTLSLLLGLRAAAWIEAQGWFPNVNFSALLAARPDYDYYLGIFATRIFQFLLFEITIYSAVRSYATVARRPAAPADLTAPAEGALTRALLRLILLARRLLHVIEQMVLYMLATLRTLARDIARVITAFLRELAVPALAVIAIGILLHRLALDTVTYIESGRPNLILPLLALGGATLAALMIFVGCKTPFRWGRVARFYGQLVGWLLPNLLVFFLLMSFSLWLSGRALNQDGQPILMPYRLGLLTQIVSALVGAMVLLVLLRKRALLHATAPSAAPPELAPSVEPAQHQSAPAKSRWFRLRTPKEPRPGLLERAAGVAREKARGTGLDVHAQRARELAGEGVGFVKEQLKGKPAIVDRIERSTARIAEKSAQIASLATIGGTLEPATRERIERQHRSELRILIAERDELMVEYSRILTRQREFSEGLKAQLAELEAQLAQLDQLAQAGALSAPDLAREKKRLAPPIEVLRVRLQASEQMLAALRLPDVAEAPIPG